MRSLVRLLLHTATIQALQPVNPERQGAWEGEEIEQAKAHASWLHKVRCLQVLELLGDPHHLETERATSIWFEPFEVKLKTTYAGMWGGCC